MTKCHITGKLHMTLDSLSYHSLVQLLHHLPPDDVLLEGESLQTILQRMKKLRAQPGGERLHEEAVAAVGWNPDHSPYRDLL